MKIKVKESTMVKPMRRNATTTLWISNLDATIPSMHILLLYFYRSTGTAANFFNPVALSRTLLEFYPVAGRLKKDDKDRIEIECNGDGALLVEAEADGEMDELRDFAPRPELRLIPEVDYSQGISAYPLLLLQVTRFKCGGVCLGVAIEHHVTDGFSAFHFITAWSRIARGLDVAVPPFLDRRVLSARNPPEPKFTHSEYDPPPVLKHPEGNSVNSETIFSIFKLSRDQINALKSSCQVDERVSYSTYEVLAGHIWRCVCKARGLPEDQESKLYIPVEGRSRLRPPLPPGYFGNVIFTAAPIALCGELESNSLRFVVGKIHEALARMDDEYLRSALDYIELKVDMKSHASGGSPFKCPNLGIISWVRFPVYDADFGWGKPLYMGLGSPPSPSEGKINLLPSPIDDGSLLCAISLPEEQMQIFEKLLYQI